MITVTGYLRKDILKLSLFSGFPAKSIPQLSD